MQEDRNETEPEAQIDGSRRKLALALLGGFAGASLLQACEEEPGAPGVLAPPRPQPDIDQLQQGLALSMVAYDAATELTSNPGPPSGSQIAIAAGRAARGDGGGGEFYWDPVSTRTSDGKIVFGTATQGRWICLRLRFENVAALKAFDTTGLATGTAATISGYFTPNDGGQGELYFDAASTEPTEVLQVIPGLALPPGAVVTGSGNAIIEGTNFKPTVGPGKWHRVGVNSSVRRVRRPEEWGADNTGTTDSTYALQVALLWCEKEHAYLHGMGKYLISDTLYVTGIAWGFEFGPAGDFYVGGSTGGLIWNGGDHTAGLTEDTYKPMIHIGKVRPPPAGAPALTPAQAEPGVLGLQCGPICLNNRVHASLGICGIKWTSHTTQCAGCDFKQIEIYGMDGGLILGTRSFQTLDPEGFPRHDVAENAVFSVVRMYEVKHPIYINGATNDMITFENVIVGVYWENSGAFWNGPSNYGIRVNSIQNGLTFKKITIGHMDMVTDSAIIDVVAGGIDIGLANIENGGSVCLAFRASSFAAGRGPIILRNVYTSEFRDSSNNVARIDAAYGVIMDGCSWRGNVHITPNTGFVTGTCLFVGNYNFTGNVDRRVSVATFHDLNGDYVLENKRVGGPHNADTYSALTSVTAPLVHANGTIKNFVATERTSQAESGTHLLFAGVARDLFDVVFPAGLEAAAMVDLECLFYRGNSMTNTFAWKASARYTIHKTPAGAFTVTTGITVPPDAEKAFVGSFTTATAVATAVPGTNKVTLQLTQTNNLGDPSRAQLKATMIQWPSSAVTLTPLTT